jgi:hypothetical protein
MDYSCGCLLRRDRRPALCGATLKAVPEKGAELLAILHNVLLEAHLNNQDRLKQLVLEEKASKESS